MAEVGEVAGAGAEAMQEEEAVAEEEGEGVKEVQVAVKVMDKAIKYSLATNGRA